MWVVPVPWEDPKLLQEEVPPCHPLPPVDETLSLILFIYIRVLHFLTFKTFNIFILSDSRSDEI